MTGMPFQEVIAEKEPRRTLDPACFGPEMSRTMECLVRYCDAAELALMTLIVQLVKPTDS